LKAPFPYFGGKSAVADLVWSRFGDPRNYIEPFFGSGAMLLRRPSEPKVETVNDLSGFVVNFWRAVKHDPEAVAYFADDPVNESEMHARHRWLVLSRKARASLARVKADPHHFDPKIAGWWCHGACCWIGAGWCETPESVAMPRMEWCVTGGTGVNGAGPQALHLKRPRAHTANSGPNGWLPGVLTGPKDGNRPQLADAFARGRGVNGNDRAGTCAERRAWLTDWMLRLADRIRPVRVCCGHWKRVCDSPSTTTRLGLTGVFLDPPYRVSIAGKANRNANLYANDATQDVNALCDEVQAWCLEWGGVPDMRIAVCGLDGEYPALEEAGWEVVAWKARGGYGNQSGKVNDNAHRERLWFSPGCVVPRAAKVLF